MCGTIDKIWLLLLNTTSQTRLKTVNMMSNSMQRAMALCHHSTYLHYLDGVPLRAITPLRRTLWLTSGEASADSVLESSSNTESAAKHELTGHVFQMI